MGLLCLSYNTKENAQYALKSQHLLQQTKHTINAKQTKIKKTMKIKNKKTVLQFVDEAQ